MTDHYIRFLVDKNVMKVYHCIIQVIQRGDSMEFVFDNERPIYIQLVEGLEKTIVNGNLSPGERLPSVRELAASAKVNPNTMQKALGELENMGLVYTERTNGKFVTKDEKLIEKHGEKYANAIAQRYLIDMENIGYDCKDAILYLSKIGGKK